MGAGAVVSLFGIAVSIAVALIVSFPLSGQLKRHPWAFYLAAVALVVIFIVLRQNDVRSQIIRWTMPIFQKGYLAMAFLFVVMFTGVFDEGTPMRKRLQPIRGELSILSFIFICGHIASYLPSYLSWLGNIFTTRGSFAASLVIAFILAIVFCALAVTSFRAVRAAMPPAAWKRLQRLSYVMMVLLLAHILLAIGASAIKGGAMATASIIIYTVILGVYAILRVRKALRDRKKAHGVATQ